MGSKSYSTSVDMWSAGCILAEMIASQVPVGPLTRNASGQMLRLPLFPGFDHKDMVQRIVQVLGHPTPEVLEALSMWEPKAKNFVDRQPYMACDIYTHKELTVTGIENSPNYCTISSEPPPTEEQKIYWKTIFPWASDSLLDLLDRLLKWDPEERISSDEALRHPYFVDGLPKHLQKGPITEQELDYELRKEAVRSGILGDKTNHAQWERFWTKCEIRCWRKS